MAVRTEPERGVAPPSSAEPGGRRPSPSLRVAMPADRVSSWLWAALVTLLAGALRLIGLGQPGNKIFDEVYYAKDAHDLLRYGVERNTQGNGPGFVVHPPLGKWLIAAGEWLFGYNAVGWRFAAAVVGTLSVLVIVRVARRMTRSTLLGCAAGLLLGLDGLHFVQSRVAMLDIFLMWWVLLAFACLLVDRDAYRARLAADPSWRGRRPWRLAAAVCLGLALATKWSALWYLPALFLLSLAWDAGAHRAAGAANPVRRAVLRDLVGLTLAAVVVAGLYVAAWGGWLLTSGGWDRADPRGPLAGLLHYHQQIWNFHAHLTAHHPYASKPWSWLLLARPVAYYYATPHGCGAPTCSAEVLAIGNPVLWWGFVAVLVAMVWRWLAHRDWRAAAVLVGAGAGLLVWLPFGQRTMFLFYALPALPFLVLGTTLVLGMAIGPRRASRERRIVGAGAAAVYVGLVAAAFAYFYPVLAGLTVTYATWHQLMWFPSWI